MTALRVFISYSHVEDENGFLKKFETHLKPLVREGLIEPWHDRRITAGTEWAGQINEHLSGAQIVILLVSPDFLGSDYCNDVEMTQAMELYEAGLTRVVAVILRPCDWSTSRFAKLKVLPQDGKAVIKWSPEEDGFVNVTQALREVVRELRGREEVGGVLRRDAQTLPERSRTILSRRQMALAIAGLLVLLVVFVWGRQQASLIAEGDKALNTSRYDVAAKSYDQVLRVNPFSDKARVGSGIATLGQCENCDVGKFYGDLRKLRAKAPDNPYLEILEGQFRIRNNLNGTGYDDAMPHFENAAKLNPELADAFFYQGLVLDHRGDVSGALPLYEKAANLEPATPRYRLNIAVLKFRQGAYQEAQQEYRSIAYQNLLLADINLSEVDRLLGQMPEAKSSGLSAISLLEDAKIANSPQNRGAWGFVVDQGKILLTSQKDKLCYAQLSLSSTLFLAGENAESAKLAAAAKKECATIWPELGQILERELALFKTRRPDKREQVDQFLKNLRTEYR